MKGLAWMAVGLAAGVAAGSAFGTWFERRQTQHAMRYACDDIKPKFMLAIACVNRPLADCLVSAGRGVGAASVACPERIPELEAEINRLLTPVR